MKELFDSVTKRKSVRKYGAPLTQNELDYARDCLSQLSPLCPDIAVRFDIVPAAQTDCKFNADSCLLCYSERKGMWLANVGYMLEQWDLLLAARDIGVCWYGMGKAPDVPRQDGLQFAIMLCFGKSADGFRSSADEFSRKSEAFWTGDDADLYPVRDAVRLAPSAVNSQPWAVEQSGNCLKVYRKYGENLLLARRLAKYFNKIDIGIFLAFVDVALERYGYAFERQLLGDDGDEKRALVATYTLRKG